MGTFPDFSDPQFYGPGSLQFPSNTLPPSLATALYRPTPAATFPNQGAPAPLSIPPAQPPNFPALPDAAASPAPAASPWNSIGQGINNGINNGLTNHALTLMALGAGIAQGGIGHGLALAATAAESERNRQAQQVNFLQTYNALVNGGVPKEEAMAAISNPSLMRAVALKYLGPRSAANAPGAAAAPTNAAISDASPPPVPPNVSNAMAYSPSRNLWKDSDGNVFDHQGKAVR
jgi:hypothetical protein